MALLCSGPRSRNTIGYSPTSLFISDRVLEEQVRLAKVRLNYVVPCSVKVLYLETLHLPLTFLFICDCEFEEEKVRVACFFFLLCKVRLS